MKSWILKSSDLTQYFWNYSTCTLWEQQIGCKLVGWKNLLTLSIRTRFTKSKSAHAVGVMRWEILHLDIIFWPPIALFLYHLLNCAVFLYIHWIIYRIYMIYNLIAIRIQIYCCTYIHWFFTAVQMIMFSSTLQIMVVQFFAIIYFFTIFSFWHD